MLAAVDAVAVVWVSLSDHSFVEDQLIAV